MRQSGEGSTGSRGEAEGVGRDPILKDFVCWAGGFGLRGSGPQGPYAGSVCKFLGLLQTGMEVEGLNLTYPQGQRAGPAEVKRE